MIHPRVAIVVVTYNSVAEIGACLDSLRGVSGAEVIVVDNASSDATCAEVRRRNVRLIANPENTGFAAAVNTGVRATDSPLVLLLNPDAHVLRGLDSLAACFDDPRTGGAGGLLLSPDGSPQTGFLARRLPSPATLIFEALGLNRIWPRNPVNWHYRCFDFDPMVRQHIEQPPGAFFMFRRTAWEQVRGFDERFWPVWFEDVDFCARLKADGWTVCYEPNAVATHRGAHSIRSLSVEKRQRYWYLGLLGYAGKHFSPVIFRFVCLAVMAGAAGRAVAGVRWAGVRSLAVYAAVFQLALRSMFTQRRAGDLVLCSIRREIR